MSAMLPSRGRQRVAPFLQTLTCCWPGWMFFCSEHVLAVLACDVGCVGHSGAWDGFARSATYLRMLRDDLSCKWCGVPQAQLHGISNRIRKSSPLVIATCRCQRTSAERRDFEPVLLWPLSLQIALSSRGQVPQKDTLRGGAGPQRSIVSWRQVVRTHDKEAQMLEQSLGCELFFFVFFCCFLS